MSTAPEPAILQPTTAKHPTKRKTLDRSSIPDPSIHPASTPTHATPSTTLNPLSPSTSPASPADSPSSSSSSAEADTSSPSSSDKSTSSDSSPQSADERTPPPPMRETQDAQPVVSMRARLAAFLPALRAANESLPAEGAGGFEILDGEDGGHEDVAGDGNGGEGGEGGEGQYIEMDLGLGVLETLNGGTLGDLSEEEDEGADESVGAGRDDAVLDTLMGKRPKKRRKLIDEV